MKKDPMKTMIAIVCVLAVITVCAVGLFVLTSKSGILQQAELKKEANRIAEENQQIVDEFNAAKAEQQNQPQQNTNNENVPSTENTVREQWRATIIDADWRVEDVGSAGLENTRTETINRSELLEGGLLLVNAWHSLPSDFSDANMISVGSTSSYQIQVKDNNVKLFPAAYAALDEALRAAKEAGLEHYLVQEGYRSVAEQETLFNAKMEKLSTKYSGDALIAQTKKEVNYPGTSDYHTGMSFRMDVYEKNNAELNNKKFQAETEQAAWLTENCWQYGIVFRFPTKNFPNEKWTDKSYKTGVSSALNLYRYVGKAHSAVMKVMDMCLEEYIEFLIDHPHICVYENGSLKYEIVRMNGVGQLEDINIPVVNVASSYQASFDNMNGVVVAYTYE